MCRAFIATCVQPLRVTVQHCKPRLSQNQPYLGLTIRAPWNARLPNSSWQTALIKTNAMPLRFFLLHYRLLMPSWSASRSPAASASDSPSDSPSPSDSESPYRHLWQPRLTNSVVWLHTTECHPWFGFLLAIPALSHPHPHSHIPRFCLPWCKCALGWFRWI